MRAPVTIAFAVHALCFRTLLLAVGFALAGCSTIAPPAQSGYVSNKMASRSERQTVKHRTICSEWRYDDLLYRDRNGDGVIDWERRGHIILDVPVFMREDTDYNGFFDRESYSGGLVKKYDYVKEISIPVPPLHLWKSPTRRFYADSTNNEPR